jgi:hypothetical protein
MDGAGFLQRKLTVTSPKFLCELEVFIDRSAKRVLALRMNGVVCRHAVPGASYNKSAVGIAKSGSRAEAGVTERAWRRMLSIAVQVRCASMMHPRV